MIFAVSGSQGQGKSTTLKHLEDRGYNVLPNKTARTILQEYGMTLNEVYLDKQLTVKFHNSIIEQHAMYCQPYINTTDIVFIERSYADIFSYALSILGPFNEYSDWLDAFYIQCRTLQDTIKATYYLTGRQIAPQADGVRSTNRHFAANLDSLILKTANDFSYYNIKRTVTVSCTEPLERVSMICEDINLYEGWNNAN